MRKPVQCTICHSEFDMEFPLPTIKLLKIFEFPTFILSVACPVCKRGEIFIDNTLDL